MELTNSWGLSMTIFGAISPYDAIDTFLRKLKTTKKKKLFRLSVVIRQW